VFAVKFFFYYYYFVEQSVIGHHKRSTRVNELHFFSPANVKNILYLVVWQRL